MKNRNNTLKIAMFGQKRIPSREGGIEVVVEELSTRMVQLGHQVTCYNRSGHHVRGTQFNSDTEATYKGVKLKKVFTIDKKGLAAMTSSLSAALLASFSAANVVHIHAEGPAAMSFIPKIFGKRIIVTIHGLDWARAKWNGFATKYIKWGEKQAVKHADRIIVLSRNVQQYFKDTYNRETVFIPNGVSEPEIIPAKEITERWNLSRNSYVLYLGRIVPEKGIQYLLEAWKGIHTDKSLVIAGGSSDSTEFMNELMASTKEMKNVIFTGFQQGEILQELFSNAYIYVLPSDLEGMPLSLLEAMSYGNCCLVSDVPECAEIVSNKALLFKKSNVDDLQTKLNILLRDHEIVKTYKLEARKFICNKYTWDEVVEKTIDVYRS